MSDHKPITGELREKLAEYEPQETGDAFVARQVGRTGYDAMIAMCDRIDAIHAGLERENAELIAKLERVTGEQEKHDRCSANEQKPQVSGIIVLFR